MNATIKIERGERVDTPDGERFEVLAVLSFESVLAQNLKTGQPQTLLIRDLRPPTNEVEKPEAVPDLAGLDERDWDEARRRLNLIRPFLDDRRHSRMEVEQRAAEFGVHTNTIYNWINAYRTSGKLSGLLPRKPSGGKGKIRLSAEVEEVIRATIESYYLTKQQRTVKDTADEIARRCRTAQLPIPHRNTVRQRIQAVPEWTRLKRRANAKVAIERFTSRPGTFDEPQRPLAVVQVDHTRLDLVVVDERDRRPVGRPWITLAFDVYSRMVVGFYISLDPPGAFSTGMCVAHSVLPKEAWLGARGVKHEWPCWGFPAVIHLDNAREFRGEMLRRACEQYAIELNFRPVATPHFGGHIERMLGTLLKELHKLPGTTFSNPRQRAEYDSDSYAALTLAEMETWIAEFITGVYHARLHSGIKTTPLARWTEAILGDGNRLGSGLIPRPTDDERIRLDFMPYYERTVQQYGVLVNGIFYYSEVLRPYTSAAERRKKKKFIFKQDPRDISVLYFWDPELKQYSEVPYRNTSHPPMSVWELREVQRRLKDAGRDEVDERAIFEAYERLRQHEENAVASTKRIRRAAARRTATTRTPRLTLVKPAPNVTGDRDVDLGANLEPFDIEDL